VSTIRIEAASVRYGVGRHAVTAIDGVSLTVPSGRSVGLVGESGSGKSTLARAVVGLQRLSGGGITIGDTPVRGRPRRTVQLVFQDPYASLDPRRTVGQSVLEGLGHPGAGRRRADDAVAGLLEQVGLEPSSARRFPSQLSGGQRQRVALARALAARPSVLVADEITSALDASVQGAILNLVRELQRTNGFSLLFISHNLAVVRYVADTVAVMYCGQIVEEGTTEQVLAEPEHPYTRSLLASVPSLDDAVPVAGGAAATTRTEVIATADPADPANPPAGCRFHLRCPVGPLVVAGRGICETGDPTADAANRRHRAACFFAPPPTVWGGTGADPNSEVLR
jgi:peptide/nickel transport system ATP-binding protein